MLVVYILQRQLVADGQRNVSGILMTANPCKALTLFVITMIQARL